MKKIVYVGKEKNVKCCGFVFEKDKPRDVNDKKAKRLLELKDFKVSKKAEKEGEKNAD